MTENEPHRRLERIDNLMLIQQALERIGICYIPIEKEHTEGLIIDPVIHRLNSRIAKRGFGNVAGKVAISFSGYETDPREIHAIPEARSYWQTLDKKLPEFPALLTVLPICRYNGPSLHMMLCGNIADFILDTSGAGYIVRISDGPEILKDAVKRIQQAATKYHLSQQITVGLIEQFRNSVIFYT